MNDRSLKKMDKITELHNYLDDNNVKLSLLHLQVIEKIMIDYAKEYHQEQLRIGGVVSSCVDKETLIEDLDDKRIVGVTLNEDMWHYCRKETAEHLLDKYEIKTK